MTSAGNADCPLVPQRLAAHRQLCPHTRGISSKVSDGALPPEIDVPHDRTLTRLVLTRSANRTFHREGDGQVWPIVCLDPAWWEPSTLGKAIGAPSMSPQQVHISAAPFTPQNPSRKPPPQPPYNPPHPSPPPSTSPRRPAFSWRACLRSPPLSLRPAHASSSRAHHPLSHSLFSAVLPPPDLPRRQSSSLPRTSPISPPSTHRRSPRPRSRPSGRSSSSCGGTQRTMWTTCCPELVIIPRHLVPQGKAQSPSLVLSRPQSCDASLPITQDNALCLGRRGHHRVCVRV